MATIPSPESPAYPDIRDPRVMIAVARDRRGAMTSLWALAARLTQLLRDAREPILAQIKLAWWRDMLALLARDPDALPKGEPLLAALQNDWARLDGLSALVDAAEAMLLAEGDEGRRAAAEAFGAHLFALSSASNDIAGARWGFVWGAMLPLEEAEARALLRLANDRAPQNFTRDQRALLMLDRWAHLIAQNQGDRRWRSEGWLLFRLGLLGR